MQVDATETKQVTVELDDFTVREIVISEFCDVFDIPRNAYIKDGMLMQDEEYTYPGTWREEIKIREATTADVMAISTLAKLLEEL